MLHYEHVFGNVFEKREKVNVVEYWWNTIVKISTWSSICYRYWQWIHWMAKTKEKAPINLHFTCQLTCIYETLKSNISEAYKVQVDCFKIHSLILMIKMMWKRKWMTWWGNVRKIKNSIIFRINPSSYIGNWHCFVTGTVQNILMSLNTLPELHMKSKNRWNISNTCF